MPRTQTNASLKNYMKEVEKVVETVVEPVILKPEPVIAKPAPVIRRPEPIDPPDLQDVPDGAPTVEDRPIIVEKPRIVERVVEMPRVVEPLQEKIAPTAEPINEAREMFYQGLLEKMDHLNDVRPISVVVETTESHIERLLKIERSMLELTNQCVASVKQKLQEEVMASREMINTLVVNRDMVDVIVNSQQKIVESQHAIVSVIQALSAQIAAINTNQQAPIVNVPAPIINIPAPVVNITENSRHITKTVERDEKGFISKVIENSSSDDV